MALVAPAHPAVARPAAPDRTLEQAGNRLNDANTRVDDLTRALDETASSYEQANAHRIRLADEVAASVTRVAQAQAHVVVAEEELVRRVTAAYKHPGGDMGVKAALLDTPDAGGVLHRTALFRRFAARGVDQVDNARRITEMTNGDARQEQIVAAGVTDSVDEWQRHAGALRTALRGAKNEVDAAAENLAAARADAQWRAEEDRRAEAARQAAASLVTQTGSSPSSAPAVDGKVCPVGQPNGFIDSWGFPRPGGRSHQGVDMFAPYDTPLFAVADGVIHRVYTNPLGGLAINLIDTDGNMYYYAHLASASAVTGQEVRAGDTIGTVGTSGNAAGTPPHLHWQFHPDNGPPVNPYPLAYALCR
ncbi:MAG: peptidoglycan DD-metalloendopeptidase family protein [Nitriliruptorales bacterium]|nr:peptidoglycan DD-metalloendopeptidase family protein [Nitriliruptorales bacterium]